MKLAEELAENLPGWGFDTDPWSGNAPPQWKRMPHGPYLERAVVAAAIDEALERAAQVADAEDSYDYEVQTDDTDGGIQYAARKIARNIRALKG